MSTPEERLKILERLERGEISPEEAALRLSGDARSPMSVLEAIEKGDLSTEEALEQIEASRAQAAVDPPAERSDWADQMPGTIQPRPRGPWMLGVWLGVIALVLGTMWMLSRLQGPGMDFWFYCAWLPIAVGVLLIALGWSVSNSPWVSVRVRSQEAGRDFRLHFSLPLPVGLARSGLGMVRGRISHKDLDLLTFTLAELEKGVRPEEPIVIRVDDDEEGDQVELVIA
jgi:hypothetical protein